MPLFPFDRLLSLQTPPPPFTPGDAYLWTDPHVARQLLAAHLDPHTDAASRKPETVARSAAWVVEILGLQPGQRLLDLGCGPGLYAVPFARAGLQVTGVDISPTSIDYARAAARQEGLEIDYRCHSYLELDFEPGVEPSVEPSLEAGLEARFDAAVLIYGDFCPLSPEQRARLLANLRRALRPGGAFVLDVTTPPLRRRLGLKNSWYASPGGFWRPTPHLVLEQGFSYPGEITLDQYVLIEGDGTLTTFRNWYQDYTPETICAELTAHGFAVDSLWCDLLGTPYQPASEWIGLVTHRQP